MPAFDREKAGSVPPTAAQKFATAFVVFAPLAIVMAMLFYWRSFAIMAAVIQIPIWYLLTVNGVTVSFHRELTHRALRLMDPARYLFAWFGIMSLEGLIRDWVAEHRLHHMHTDKVGDPHSPHGDEFGPGVMGVLKGFFHAHMGWFFRHGAPSYDHIDDILEDKGLVWLDKMFPVWAVLTFVLPGLITLIWVPTIRGFFAGVFWGGFVRVFLVHHVTWSINSVCHLWGTRPFSSNDESTNNFFFGYIGGGEGWHRNHHAFPRSARIGLRWWEFDMGWIVIKMLDLFGYVETLHVPKEEDIERRRTKSAA